MKNERRYLKHVVEDFISVVTEAIVLAIWNIKGGVAKTTSSLVLAKIFVDHGLKVLLVESDAQGSASQSIGALDCEYTLGDILLERCELHEAISKTEQGFDIIRADLSLIDDDESISKMKFLSKDTINEYLQSCGVFLNQGQLDNLPHIEHNTMLRDMITVPLKSQYDIILIDNSPYFTPMVENSLIASDYLCVPMKMDNSSLSGYESLTDKIQMVKDFNHNISVLGLLPTMYKGNTNVHSTVYEILSEDVDEQMFTPIPQSIAVDASPFSEQTIVETHKNNPVSRAYRTAAQEILEAILVERGVK